METMSYFEGTRGIRTEHHPSLRKMGDAYDIDDVREGPSGPPNLIYEGFGTSIPGLPTRADLIRKGDGAHRVIKDEARIGQGADMHFLPNDIHEGKLYQNGSASYVLHMFGVLPSGMKAHVIVRDLDLYFDVRVPDGKKKSVFQDYLRVSLADSKAPPLSAEIIQAYPIRGFRESPVDWVRLRYATRYGRKEAIKIVRNHLECETASDDLSGIHRVMARNYGYVYTDWGVLRNYKARRGGGHPGGAEVTAGKRMPVGLQSPLCEYVFEISPEDFQPIVPPAGTKEERDLGEASKKRMGLVRDRSLVLTWDIETYDAAETGDLPLATRASCCVFMICLTVHFKDDPRPLCQVCLTDTAADPDERWYTVNCGNEENLVRAFPVVVRTFAPECHVGFNDGQYDWPFFVEKANQYDSLGYAADMMSAIARGSATDTSGAMRYNVERGFDGKGKQVKISADESAYVICMNVPGLVIFDVRTIFRKLFPKADIGRGTSSLNFYLKTCKLSSKADMPYTKMWEIYKSRDVVGMRRVAHYCVVDALRCQQLLVKRNVINDNREVSAIAYTNLYDALYYAGGGKVRNLLIAAANRRGYLCSNIGTGDKKSGKYPGAWVFHPRKGLYPDPSEPSLRAIEAARHVLVQLHDRIANPTPPEAAAEMDPAIPGSDPATDGAETAEKALKTHRKVCAMHGDRSKLPEAIQHELEAAEAAIEYALKHYEPKRPVVGLDFKSLYPSIIMTYNLSPEKFVATREQAEDLKAKGYNLYHIEKFEFGGELMDGWFVRHNSVPENYGLYPTILMDLFGRRALMKKRLIMREEQIEHMDHITATADKTGDFEKAFVDDLAQLKTRWEELKDAPKSDRNKFAKRHEVQICIEVLEIIEAGWRKGGDLREAFDSVYEEYSFEYLQIDSKQKALKVFMNTFYGEAGNQRSAFFLVQLAGAVTMAGRYNIKKVDAFVQAHSFQTNYGDTDSVYVSAPNAAFTESDRDYAYGRIDREEYWTQLVLKTMVEIKAIRDKVNVHLEEDNKTKHLIIAYEEALWPCALLGKKKYYGIPHVAVPNFNPKKLFIRGIDIIKQGQDEYAKKIGNRIMWESVSIDNDDGLFGLTKRVVTNAIEDQFQWSFDDFIKSAAWKPNKDNKAVQQFMARMRARVAEETHANQLRTDAGEDRLPTIYYIPEPGQRFRYVLVKMRSIYDLRGLKRKGKNSDVMEYTEVAKAKDFEVDIARYLANYIVGLCARFILYMPQFMPSAQSTDKESRDLAAKFLKKFILSVQGINPEIQKKRGYAYKRAWKKAAADCGSRIWKQLGTKAEILHGATLDWELFLEPDPRVVTAEIAERAALEAIGEKFGGLLAALCQRFGVDPKRGSDLDNDGSAKNLYQLAKDMSVSTRRDRRRGATSYATYILSALNGLEETKRQELAKKVGGLRDLSTRYELSVAAIVDIYRNEEHQTNAETLGGAYGPGAEAGARWTFNPSQEEQDCITEVRALWYDLVGVYRMRAMYSSWEAYLARLKELRVRKVVTPTRFEARQEAREALIPTGATRVQRGRHGLGRY
jgi:DNA polymerase elongation subunit (family B)